MHGSFLLEYLQYMVHWEPCLVALADYVCSFMGDWGCIWGMLARVLTIFARGKCSITVDFLSSRVLVPVGHIHILVRNEQMGGKCETIHTGFLVCFTTFKQFHSNILLQHTQIQSCAGHLSLMALNSPIFILAATYWNKEHLLKKSCSGIDPYHSLFLVLPLIHKLALGLPPNTHLRCTLTHLQWQFYPDESRAHPGKTRWDICPS